MATQDCTSRTTRHETDGFSGFATKKRVAIASAITSAIAFAIVQIAGPALAAIFVKPGDDELLAMGIAAIHLFSFSYIVGWVDSSFSSFLTALDRPARSMVAAAFGTLVFPIASLFLLTPVLGLNGVWLTAPVSAFAGAVLAIILAKTIPDTPRSDGPKA